MCLGSDGEKPGFFQSPGFGLNPGFEINYPGFSGLCRDPIDFTSVTDLIGLYRVQSTIVKCFKVIGSFLVFNIVILRVFISKMFISFHN